MTVETLQNKQWEEWRGALKTKLEHMHTLTHEP